MKIGLLKRKTFWCYLWGVISGVSLGIYIGAMFMLGLSVSNMGKTDEYAVIISLSALQKIQQNDTPEAQQMLLKVIANSYLDHMNLYPEDQEKPWYTQTLYQNKRLIKSVEKAIKSNPDLIETIENQRAERRITHEPG